jgi:hypothetical protein
MKLVTEVLLTVRGGAASHAIVGRTTFRLPNDEGSSTTVYGLVAFDLRNGGGGMEKQDFSRFHPMRRLGDAVDRGARAA